MNYDIHLKNKTKNSISRKKKIKITGKYGTEYLIK